MRYFELFLDSVSCGYFKNVSSGTALESDPRQLLKACDVAFEEKDEGGEKC
jgi:hypothetical protein